MTDGADDDAPAAFAALMRRLGTEGPRGEAYETLRQRLIRFFRLHLPTEAEALADMALDRLARRLRDGTAVVDAVPYALGIARFVLREAHARRARQQRAQADPTLWPHAEADAADGLARDGEAVAAALDDCLGNAGPAARDLILEYYGADGAERIRARRELAERLGLSVNALRNRALRLRDALERCVSERVGDGPRA